MKKLTDYSLQELKFIYNLLSIQLPQSPKLMETEFWQQLQEHLINQATSEGIEVSSPQHWSNWLTHKD
jgi:hypothetical protein